MRDISFFRLVAYLGAGCVLAACHRPIVIPDPAPIYESADVVDLSEVETFLTDFGLKEEVSSDPAGRLLSSAEVRRLAVTKHPEVVAARYRYDEAAAHLKSSSAWPNPELAGRVVTNPDGALDGEGALLLSLPMGGRIGAAIDEAELKLARIEAQYGSVRKRALSGADRLLLRLALARARLALFERMASLSGKYAELARSRRAASMADPLDVALVLADAARDRGAVKRTEGEVELIERELALFLGIEAETRDFAAPPLQRIRLTESGEALEEASLKHRPDVRVAQLAAMAADREAARVAAERIPDLKLGPAMTSENGEAAVGLSFGIELPLLSRGSGPYAEALARREKARSAYRQSCREAVSDVGDRLVRYRSIDGELASLLTEASGAIEGALSLAEVRYTAGRLDVLRLLSIHRAFTDVRLEFLDLLFRQHETIVDLEEAVGRSVHIEEVMP